MKRYHQELRRTTRVHRLHLRWVHGWPRRSVDCVCDLQPGRFRKSKALGCGRPRCLICHYEKVLGIPSVKDRVRRNRYADSLRDYRDSHSGTGIPPVNHAQDARATSKLHHYQEAIPDRKSEDKKQVSE